MRPSSSIRVIAFTAAVLGLAAPAHAERPVGGVLGPGPDPGPPPTSAQQAKCQRGDASACLRIAGWHQAQPANGGDREAARYYELACKTPPARRGRPRLGCAEASNMYRQGKGIPKSERARARRLSKLGCDSGDGLACWHLAGEENDGTDAGRRRARALMARSCRFEYRHNCERFGVPRPRGR